MIYKCHKMGSFNLHIIKTNRFKNIRMEINFRNNIDAKKLVYRTVLFDMLLESNEYYKTKRDIILKCEELYNASIYTQGYKVGNEIVNTIYMDFLNPTIVNDDYLEEALKLPFDLIFNPDVIDNEFNEVKLEIIKNLVNADIEALKENPRNYSIMKSFIAMDENSITSKSLLGSKEELDSITKSNLYQEYLNILEHDYIDIYIIGDIDENKVIDIINKYQHFNTIKNHELTLYVDNKKRAKVKKVIEKSNFKQSQIVIILNANNLTKEESSYAAHIYNHILGGGSLDTKLYKKLRGENSLCYSVSSSFKKYDKLIVITTSVDKKNIKKSIKLIEETIKDMKNSVTNEEVNNAISSIITSIVMSMDSETQIISNYYFNEIAELDLIEERIEKYKNVTLQDVINIANKVSINTIYIMEGENHE